MEYKLSHMFMLQTAACVSVCVYVCLCVCMCTYILKKKEPMCHRDKLQAVMCIGMTMCILVLCLWVYVHVLRVDVCVCVSETFVSKGSRTAECVCVLCVSQFECVACWI